MKLETMEDVFNYANMHKPEGSFCVRMVSRRLMLIPLVKEGRSFDERPCIITGDSEEGYRITFKETGTFLEFKSAKAVVKYAMHYVRYYNRYKKCEVYI